MKYDDYEIATNYDQSRLLPKQTRAIGFLKTKGGVTITIPVIVGVIVIKHVQQGEDKHTIFKYVNSSFDLNQPCRVKYKKIYFHFLDMIVVTGELLNGKEYNTWVDTGHPCCVLTNGVTILDNDLAIYPLGQNLRNEFTGFCHLPKLQIGQYSISRRKYLYQFRHLRSIWYGNDDGNVAKDFRQI